MSSLFSIFRQKFIKGGFSRQKNLPTLDAGAILRPHEKKENPAVGANGSKTEQHNTERRRGHPALLPMEKKRNGRKKAVVDPEWLVGSQADKILGMCGAL